MLRSILILILHLQLLFFPVKSFSSLEMSSSNPISCSSTAIHWFRKGLRLHDNPALLEACRQSSKVYPLFVIDPNFAKPSVVGINRYGFLLEALRDLDASLRRLGSRLYVVRGKPEETLERLITEWNVDLLTFEVDTEPYARIRDSKIAEIKQRIPGLKISPHTSHTIYAVEQYLAAAKGNNPASYQSFVKVFDSLGKVRSPAEAPESVPSVSRADAENTSYDVPSLLELGYLDDPSTQFKGGETEALHRLQKYVLSRGKWVAAFEKPNTAPNSLEPSTTVLSPYLKFGCLSATKFYKDLDVIYKAHPQHALPPVSLHGQLLWREFFYFSGSTTPNFDKMIVSGQ